MPTTVVRIACRLKPRYQWVAVVAIATSRKRGSCVGSAGFAKTRARVACLTEGSSNGFIARQRALHASVASAPRLVTDLVACVAIVSLEPASVSLGL